MWNKCLQNWMKHYKVIFILQSAINIRFSFAEAIEVATDKPQETKDMKYILLWEAKGAFKSIFGEGQEDFIQNDCPVNKCFVTSDRFMFGGDLKQFDTILFNGWDESWVKRKEFPEKRYAYQKYAFVQRESAARAYVCHDLFDNFFNWTITYKLDSDIVFPHIHLRDVHMDVIGPRKDMYWITDMLELDEALSKDLETKTKAVAWFDSKCNPQSNSSKYVETLEKALNKYGLKIDVYGKCSTFHCPKHECDKMLDEDYYFFLALEDSFAEDYVTGSILRALRNDVVPIVYGGAKYDRFLPPHSYLDATSKTPEVIAATIYRLVNNQTQYQEYLRWKSHYSFCAGQGSPSLPSKGNSFCGQTVCDLCDALHDPSLFNVQSTYEDFRAWLYPEYEDKCPQLKNKPKKKKKVINETEALQNERKSMNLTEEELRNTSARRQSFLPGQDYWAGIFPGDIHSLAMGLGVADRLADRAFSIPGMEIPSHGGGGGGGGGVRTAGRWALEVQRIRVSVASNNFEID